LVVLIPETTMKPTILAALSFLVISTVAASAAPAVTTANANVRSAASTNSKVVVTLARGTRIDVENCRSGWCELTGRNGPRGFVSQSLLRLNGAQANEPQSQKTPENISRPGQNPTRP
jgi:uncharacterized protein YraI